MWGQNLQCWYEHFLIGNALGKSLWRLVSTVGFGLVLHCLGCTSGLILVIGVLIFALTSKLASDLFFLLPIIGLSGSISERVLSLATVSQFFEMISFNFVWQSFSLVGSISGGCGLLFGCLFSSSVLFSNFIWFVVSFISDGV